LASIFSFFIDGEKCGKKNGKVENPFSPILFSREQKFDSLLWN